jgi:hypothetical protein
MKSAFLLVLGTSLLVLALLVALGMVSGIIGMVIPFANQALQMLYTGPIVGGLMWFFVRLARGQSGGVGDAFGGFTRNFAQLLLSSLIQGLAGIACMIPIGVVAAIGIFAVIGTTGPGGEPNLWIIVPLVAICVAAVIAISVYLKTVWIYWYFLVVDKGYPFWAAFLLSWRLVHKRWWMTFLMLLVAGMVLFSGALPGLLALGVTIPVLVGTESPVLVNVLLIGMEALVCLAGLAVTVPLAYLMEAYLYDDNFRDLAPQPNF